ncbi:MAG: histidine triad nucleotide-binding protein [Candidatus Omnitrophica bacterium]|nr:histidine triad nucleotide-binding protein [Candidatus Omnitrophota bacterium]
MTDSFKDCIFCKIIKKEIPAKIVFENDTVLAFPDINPKAKTHILIIPKEHRKGLSALEENDISLSGRLMVAVADVAKKIKLDSYRVIINVGPDAGQTIFHLHLHLMSPDGGMV